MQAQLPYRTSTTDPLRIAEVKCAPYGTGVIGITFCPGKCGASVHGLKPWRRDLQADVEAVRRWGASAVVTLLEEHEFAMLNVPGLGEAVSTAGMTWLHLPIVDVNVPCSRFNAEWLTAAAPLIQLLREDRRLLVHCRGGLGRAGMVACFLLIELGAEPRDALRRVRQARPGAVETSEQEQYVLAFRQTGNRASR